MFLKPFKVKTNTTIKGSERKKLRSGLSSIYSNLSQDDLMLLVPNKEEMNVMKLQTTDNSIVIVYCQQKNPVFFEIDKIMYPTVYTLWQFPDLLHIYTTWPTVFEKLRSGADLMLPGIITEKEYNPKSFGNLNKLDPCAVNLADNKAPIGVGKAALSSVDMFLSGKRGKGVIMVHIYSDCLWALGDKSDPPTLNPPLNLSISDDENEKNGQEADVEENVGENSSESEIPKASEVPKTPDVPKTSMPENENQIPPVESLNLKDAEPELNDVDDSPEESSQLSTLSPVDVMDELLHQCFLQAWKASGKKIDLPILTSTFYKAHMLPHCPDDKNLDVKKSSYKKLSKFLQEKEKQGFIMIKELSKGVESITAVDLLHPEIRSCVVDIEPVCKETSMEKPKYEPPTIIEKFTVTATVLPLFKPKGINKGDALTGPDIRKVITEYVKENELQSQEEKRAVTLDPLLTSVICNTSENCTKLTWDDLISRCINKMKPAYEIGFPGQKPILKKGQLEPIDVTISQRAGNKKVTLVNNLETFGIDPLAFAHTIQIGVATSTSVYPAPNRKEGNEVLVQGNQINFIAKTLLDEYKVPKKYLRGLENAPKKNKRR